MNFSWVKNVYLLKCINQIAHGWGHGGASLLCIHNNVGSSAIHHVFIIKI